MSNKMDIKEWLAQFQEKLKCCFGDRLCFFGLQGSFGRGEPTDTSDIDVVVILDQVSFVDLQRYREMLDRLEFRERICGFVAGEGELIHWEKSDLIQLFLDTKPIIGSLKHLHSLFSDEDIRRAVLTGAGNLYHACSHNFLHKQDWDVLVGLYKAARFTVRMKYLWETGSYVSTMQLLKEKMSGPDRQILELAAGIAEESSDVEFNYYSQKLLEWSSHTIQDLE